MNKYILSFLFLLAVQAGFAQNGDYKEEEIKINEFTEGTLTNPSTGEVENLVILIQGSGPTDRDGNQSMAKNDGIKKIARRLAENGIASFRYDKRIFKMQELKIEEKDLRFDDFVKDARDILIYFQEKGQYKNLIVAGHSEGSLIGILASKDHANAFISLAGAGEPIDNIIVEQVNKMAPQLGQNARTAFNEIKEKGQTTNYNPMLESLFRSSVQPYMYSWMQYDPSEEIKKLDIPVLIINGTSDIQVEEKQAELLHNAKEDSKLVLLEDMNHIFRKVESDDRLVNTKSYNEPARPLHPELIAVITKFIKELE